MFSSQEFSVVEVAVGTDRISPRPDPSTHFSLTKIHISGRIYQRFCLRTPRNICSHCNRDIRLDVSESSCPQVIVDSGAWENGVRYLGGVASTGPRTRSRNPNEVTCAHARRAPCLTAKNPWTVGPGRCVDGRGRVPNDLQWSSERTRTVVVATSHDVKGTK